jgi:hypothetical protein
VRCRAAPENPVYPPALCGGGPDSPDVRLGGYFIGRSPGGAGQCPEGANPTGCLVGSPLAPLRLDPASRPCFTVFDSGIGDVQAGGTPALNGPIAILFDRDVVAVELTGGVFDAPRSTAITVYARDGCTLGGVEKVQPAANSFGLATGDLSAHIAGLEFHLCGP